MTDEERQHLKMQARMDGAELIVSQIGKKVTLSEMEMVCLATFAEVGVMSIFSCLDGDVGKDAELSYESTVDAVRKTFEGSPGAGDGLNRLSASTCAILRGKFAKYIAR